MISQYGNTFRAPTRTMAAGGGHQPKKPEPINMTPMAKLCGRRTDSKWRLGQHDPTPRQKKGAKMKDEEGIQRLKPTPWE